VILQHFPDHTILGEEVGLTVDPENPWRWVVDPIDGTINFAHNFPFWCVSIGLEHAGTPVVGIIQDPVSGRVFRGGIGLEARVDGRPLRVSKAARLSESLISVGLPTNFEKDAGRQIGLFGAFSKGTHSVRRTGSSALNLAFVASGAFDVFYATSVHPWDVAAGVVLVEAAGGKVTHLDGAPYRLDAPGILATNGLVHEEALDVIAEILNPGEAPGNLGRTGELNR
jgi:myo-inositol-1(or 4)-monophosphatase